MSLMHAVLRSRRSNSILPDLLPARTEVLIRLEGERNRRIDKSEVLEFH